VAITVSPVSSPGAARSIAREIITERRFASPSVPRPLHGVLRAIGHLLAPLTRLLGRLVRDLVGAVPGGPVVAGVALVVLLVLVVVLVGSQGLRRRLPDRSAPAEGHAPPRPASAAELDRAAERAERAGQLEEAVRLRFQGGLARLAERELIPAATATASAQVARTLRSEHFDALALRFDEIVYGGRPAAADDVEASRREWPLVVAGRAAR